MLLALTRKELRTNLLTARLALILVFAVLLCGLAALAGSLDFSQRVEDYEEEVRRVEQGLEEATVYAEVRPHVVAPPEPLSIAARQGRRLDLSDLPAFDPGWREPLSATLRHMTPGLLVMVLTTAAAMLAVFRFLRYDPS